MAKLKTIIKDNIAFWICLSASVILLVGGAVTPPPFVIDSSIFIAVGLLFLFATLGVVIKGIEKGSDVKFQKGDISVTIDNHDEPKNRHKN